VAKVTIIDIPPVPVPPPPTKGVVLTLSMDEASALLRVLYNVGGTGRRALTNQIYNGLKLVGIDPGPEDISRKRDTIHGGSIYFTDEAQE
jgi:hypothetical protein